MPVKLMRFVFPVFAFYCFYFLKYISTKIVIVSFLFVGVLFRRLVYYFYLLLSLWFSDLGGRYVGLLTYFFPPFFIDPDSAFYS